MKIFALNSKKLVACVVAVILSSGYCFSSEIVFMDTYDNTEEGLINDDIYAEGRQSGTITPLEYLGDSVPDTGDGSLLHAFIGNSNYPGSLFFDNPARCTFVSPDHNFTDLSTNFNIEFDLRLYRQSSWAGFSLHIGAEDVQDIRYEKNGFFWWFQKGNEQLLSQGKIAGTGVNSFECSELQKLEEESVHVNCIVSVDSFGGTDKAITACFINGEPITAHQKSGAVGYGTVIELNTALTNNYITIGLEKGASCSAEVDNFIIRNTTATISQQAWTNDAGSLINFNKAYTHAINCGGGDVMINGVQFTGAPDAGTPYDPVNTNWAFLNYGNGLGAGLGSDSTIIAGDGAALATNNFYSIVSSTLMLYNLTPGMEYTLTLYNNSSTNSLDSCLVPSDSQATISVMDQNQGNGNIFRYTYIAPSNGVFSMTFDNSPVNSNDAADNWRLYAFSNEIADNGPVLAVTPAILNFNAIIDDSTNAELLVENISGGTVSGNITGILEPFSISTNWYSATSNSPSTLTVVFSPTEEGNFTNVIHFSGTGGSQDVTLIGEAIPECSLFMGFLSIAGLLVRKLSIET